MDLAETCSPGSQAVSEQCQLREEMINVTHSTLQALIDPWLQVPQCSEGMPEHTCCDRIILEASMQTREMNKLPWALNSSGNSCFTPDSD